MAETRTVLAEVHSSLFKIVGNIHVSTESYRGRLTDRLNVGTHRFIPITEAKLTPRAGGKARSVDCIIVNAEDIKAAIPLEE